MTPRRATARWKGTLALAWIVATCAIAPLAAPARAQDSASVAEPAFPTPAGFVNDRAGVMREPTRARLESFLDQLHRKTGAEFAVLTVPTSAPLTPSEYKVKTFERWGLGKKGQDNGLLLLVSLEEHEAWFETGYGLEGILPDGVEARIVREDMAPRLRTGDYDGAVVAGVQAAALRIAQDKGVTLEWDGRELRYTGSRGASSPPWLPALVWLAFVIILSTALRSRRRRGFGWGPYWGGFGGGWGGGLGGGGWGGGFGGGGGGGSSFGGFGGGASGGGGGGGRW
jgi:uncharacterized protein